MRRKLVLLVAVGLTVGGVLFLWPHDPLPTLNEPDGLTILSIDPRTPISSKITGLASSSPAQVSAKPSEVFHDFPVLGKLEITDSGQRHTIIKAIKASFVSPLVAAFSGTSACWDPRHGLRAVQNGQTIDMVICFHCEKLDVYSGNVIIYQGPITLGAKTVLNDALRSAGIPQAPGPDAN